MYIVLRGCASVSVVERQELAKGRTWKFHGSEMESSGSGWSPGRSAVCDFGVFSFLLSENDLKKPFFPVVDSAVVDNEVVDCAMSELEA